MTTSLQEDAETGALSTVPEGSSCCTSIEKFAAAAPSRRIPQSQFGVDEQPGSVEKDTRSYVASQQYDHHIKEHLDEAGKSMDSQNSGYLESGEVYAIMERLQHEQEKKVNLRKTIYALCVFSVLIVTANIGAKLAKDNSASSTGNTVDEATSMRLGTTARFNSYEIEDKGDGRKLQTFAQQSISRLAASSMFRDFCTNFPPDPDDWDGTCVVSGDAQAAMHVCGRTTVLVRDEDPVREGNAVLYRYPASRDGFHYGNVEITCVDDSIMCSVSGLTCDNLCTSGGDNWFCGVSAPVCGCQVDSCFTYGTSTGCSDSTRDSPKPHATMVPITWDASNTAEIEFCGDGGSVYGYRLPGESTCGPAGIVIRMQPGQNHTLVLRNTASVPTNLHTHGLHISGSGNADDVTRSVDGGMCLTYHLDIPVEHMGGTFWMHPHRHGLTNVQVSGGAYVMLIIDEQPNLLESVDAASRIGIEKWLGNELLLVASSVGRNVLGNGKSDLELIMASNQWYRLRVAAVDPEGIRSNLVFPGTCDVHTVAYDGVWRFEVPRAEFNLEHSLTGASRRDVAIRCTAIGEHAIYFGPDASMLATLKVGIGIVGIGAFRNRPKTPEASPYTITGSSWQPYRPNYLRDLSEEHSTLFEPFNVTAGATHINGLSYNPLEPLREFDYDTLQEWTIFNTAWHPFHMHVYHMQPFGCQGHEDGEYVDTVSSPTPGCVVRFHIIDVASRVVMHCHVLIHGDAGAMAWINITNGGPIQSSVDREQYTCPTR